jgi:serine/threonine-protein kinase ATR
MIMAQSNYKPCFHRWFLEQFPDPTAWQEARARFVRSTAVWSAVGHVIGLGDRHTENILLDVSNGEMVQVDFDCLFDKGLTLQRPEIVPFRLTPNIVDAMGVTGVEGTYRRTLEVTVGVLRDHKDTLLSVLEPFLRDPTVSWSRSGRAQRNLEAATAASTTGASKTVGARDHENREAKEMLLKISQRLSGIYNIVHPHREKFLRAATKRNELPPARGIGVSKEEMLPLSVPGQVQRLIDEASAPENLVQMYIGEYLVLFCDLLVCILIFPCCFYRYQCMV